LVEPKEAPAMDDAVSAADAATSAGQKKDYRRGDSPGYVSEPG